MAETKITEEEMRQFGVGIPEPTGAGLRNVTNDFELDPTSLPIGANPDSDTYLGRNELGEKTYRMSNGREYTIRRVMPEARFTTEAGTWDRAREVAGQRVGDVVEGTVQAVTAPARAALGEGVTMGDALNTAGIVGTGVTGSTVSGRISRGEGLYDPTTTNIFAGPRSSRPSNLSEVRDTFAREGNFDADVLGFDYDPTNSMDMVVGEIETNPSRYPETIAKLEEGGWFRGRDDLLRYEIDDSTSSLKETPIVRSSKNDLKWSLKGVNAFESGFELPRSTSGEPLATPVSEILDHEDLFNAYPELKDMPVAVDTDLSGGNLGYFDSKTGLIAVSERVAGDERLLRSTLLHEIQHAIQTLEGFENGTSTLSNEVYAIKMAAENSPTFQQALADYEQSLRTYEDAALRANMEVAKTSSQELARRLLDFQVEYISQRNGVSDVEILDILGSQTFDEYNRGASNPIFYGTYNAEDLLKLSEGIFPYGLDYNVNRDLDYLPLPTQNYVSESFNRKVLSSLRTAAEVSKEEGLESAFREIVGIDPNELPNNIFEATNTQLPQKPIAPEQLDNGSFIIYQRQRGETEARNVEARMDMPREERNPSNVSSTEDTSPRLQWGAPEVAGARSGEDIYIGKFAEGGEVKSMEKQMSLFEEGGLADDGMTREPVTGNEIPAGSMAEEVRDDIDAKLSAGEYVVPADVVRFFGVKFFEDLRAKAKSDMMAMERDGRVGGEPVSADGIPMEDDELTPEEEAMLAEAMAADKGYATGGYVPSSPYAISANPYDMSGMTANYESRQYVNTQTGEIRTFQFMNGQPISLIPDGFVPATPEAIAAAEEAKNVANTATEGTGVATGQTPNNNNDRDRSPAQRVPQTNATNTAEAAVSGLPSYGVGTAGSVALGGLSGAVIGRGLMGAVGGASAGLQAANFNDARNNLVSALDSGDSAAISAAEEEVRKAYNGLTSRAARIGVFGEGSSADDAIANVVSDYENYISSLQASQQPMGSVPQTSAPVTAPATTPQGLISEAEKVAAKTSAKSSDKTSRAAPKVATTTVKPTTKGERSPAPTTSTNKSSSTGLAGARKAADKLGKDLAKGGRARGGLMGKAKKF